jgi:hypothetical protein
MGRGNRRRSRRGLFVLGHVFKHLRVYGFGRGSKLRQRDDIVEAGGFLLKAAKRSRGRRSSIDTEEQATSRQKAAYSRWLPHRTMQFRT